MTGLFDTPEAQAAVGVFRFMIQEIGGDDLKALWRDAEVGLTDDDLERGIALLLETRTFDPGKRFSVYGLQRTYLRFLEAISLREDRIPVGRGEVVLYNLGKFSQVITDYEEIHYKSRPEEKYPSFVQFLRYQAPGYYPEGGQDATYAVPDAVRIMTVHQAKGMEFPVVFLPCLQKNRFPARRQHNRVWNHIPREAIQNADRYDTGPEDERRLFYVAMTRSEKYLFCSWAPDLANQLYRRPSPFWEEMTRREQVLTNEPPPKEVHLLPPEPRRPLVNVELSFSELKYFFECPYQFKLRFLYGFNPPLHEALGYGRSLHNALAEVHRRALSGEQIADDAISDLLDTHLHVRYAYPELEASLRQSAGEALGRYLREHGPYLDRLEHAEEVVELTLPDGIVVHGRIDLIKRTDTGEVVVVDFKSVERAQAEDITRLQLHVYALGYEQRFGRRADLIEVHNLDAGGSVREVVDDTIIGATLAAVGDAGQRLRENRLDRLPLWCEKCAECDLAGLCRSCEIAAPRL
jgi:DNA helicase-2/ATP-dependent DNA helicase PcrA